MALRSVGDFLELPSLNFGAKTRLCDLLQLVRWKNWGHAGEGCLVYIARFQHTIQDIVDGAGFNVVLKT